MFVPALLAPFSPCFFLPFCCLSFPSFFLFRSLPFFLVASSFFVLPLSYCFFLLSSSSPFFCFLSAFFFFLPFFLFFSLLSFFLFFLSFSCSVFPFPFFLDWGYYRKILDWYLIDTKAFDWERMESCFTSGATNDMSLILKLLIILMERLNPFLCSTSLSPVLPSISFRLLLLRTCPSTLRWLSRRPSRLDAWQQHLAMFSVCKPVSPARNTLGRESLPPPLPFPKI